MAQDLPPLDDTTPNPLPPKARKATGLKIALAISVVLNVALIAGITSGAMRAQTMRAMPSVGAHEFYSLWRALPDDLRRDLRGESRRDGERPDRDARRQQWASRMEAEQTHRQDLAQMLRAEEFDAQEFIARLNAPRQARTMAVSRTEVELARRLDALSLSERVAIAERMESLPPRRR